MSHKAFPEMTPDIIAKIFKSRKNLLDIMRSNGYNVDDYVDFTVDEVIAMYQHRQLDMLLVGTGHGRDADSEPEETADAETVADANPEETDAEHAAAKKRASEADRVYAACFPPQQQQQRQKKTGSKKDNEEIAKDEPFSVPDDAAVPAPARSNDVAAPAFYDYEQDAAPPIRATNKVYVRYHLSDRIRPQVLNEVIDDLFHVGEQSTLTKRDTLYIVNPASPNDSLLAELKHIWERDNIFVVAESIPCLQFNILQHTLVPTHTVLRDAEVEKVKRKYNITSLTEFPNISRFDPVARAIGLRPNQVCHILRPSKTAIQSVHYRVCV